MNGLLNFVESDVKPGLLNVVGWSALSRRKLASLNRRTQFGLLWVAISTFVFISALSMVYAAIFSVPLGEYIPYIAIGYTLWGFVSNTIASAPGVFVLNSTYITQRAFPLSLYIISEVIAKFCVFAVQFSVAVCACVIFSVKPSAALFILPISFAILVIWSYGVFLMLGIISVKYRDIGQVAQSLLFIIFLCTPILWDAKILSGRAIFVDLNPIYHLIHIVRSPILDGNIPHISLAVTFVIAIGCVGLGTVLAARYGKRVVFWL